MGGSGGFHEHENTHSPGFGALRDPGYPGQERWKMQYLIEFEDENGNWSRDGRSDIYLSARKALDVIEQWKTSGQMDGAFGFRVVGRPHGVTGEWDPI